MLQQICTACGGMLRALEMSLFCLDCDWDDLPQLSDGYIIPVDAEWYLKTQLKSFRRWTHRDFSIVSADWSGAYTSRKRWGYTGNYYHKSTVEAHESTPLFQGSIRKKQLFVPEKEKIMALGWTVCVSGEELFKNGWTREMVDNLSAYRWHKWRRKRLFRLCDLSRVSNAFCVGDQTVDTPAVGQPDHVRFNPYRYL